MARMSDDYARKRERDRALVVGVCGVVTNMRYLLVNWIEEELKDQRLSTQLVQSSSSGLIQTKAQEYEEGIDEMAFHRLPEAIKAQKLRVEEVERAHSRDPFDDYLYLEESTFRIERMARMIFGMRRLLDELTRSGAPVEESDSDQAEGIHEP